MAKILYGTPVREEIKNNLILRVGGFLRRPSLLVVQVGEREDSSIYIKNKKKFGEEIGVEVIIKNFDQNITEEDLIKEIKKINEDNGVDGLIVQLPLPEHLNSENILAVIDLAKDADGLSSSFSSTLDPKEFLLVTPATARAVERLLGFYKIDVKDKKVAVIGRSKIAGGPIATMLEKIGAIVTVCHKETPNTAEICRNSDILISAAGSPGLVNKDFVRKGQVVIDVGINRIQEIVIEKTKIVGDVDFSEVEPVVGAITPVPGGVGPLTVACLFENLCDIMDTNY